MRERRKNLKIKANQMCQFICSKIFSAPLFIPLHLGHNLRERKNVKTKLQIKRAGSEHRIKSTKFL